MSTEKSKSLASVKSAGAKEATKKLNTVPLNWNEVWYTNCPLISASNIDQELGWTREECKKLGVKYDYVRNTRENNFYPHYIHNLDNLIRFIKKDFDVHQWAAPEFLEQAARDLLEEEWKEVTTSKLTKMAAPLGSGKWLG
jgi:hypothetical protein